MNSCSVATLRLAVCVRRYMLARLTRCLVAGSLPVHTAKCRNGRFVFEGMGGPSFVCEALPAAELVWFSVSTVIQLGEIKAAHGNPPH